MSRPLTRREVSAALGSLCLFARLLTVSRTVRSDFAWFDIG